MQEEGFVGMRLALRSLMRNSRGPGKATSNLNHTARPLAAAGLVSRADMRCQLPKGQDGCVYRQMLKSNPEQGITNGQLIIKVTSTQEVSQAQTALSPDLGACTRIIIPVEHPSGINMQLSNQRNLTMDEALAVACLRLG